LWPTPTAHNAKETNAPSESLRNAPTLASLAAKWPTPASNNATGGATGLAGGAGNRKKLYAMLGEEEGKKMGCQTLNPNWVEWLMGWPIGWTDLKLLVMDKYHSALQQHGEFLVDNNP
jgi:hypothetical protein